jgi:hypothetical protein
VSWARHSASDFVTLSTMSLSPWRPDGLRGGPVQRGAYVG